MLTWKPVPRTKESAENLLNSLESSNSNFQFKLGINKVFLKQPSVVNNPKFEVISLGEFIGRTS